eukprot:3939620-Pyramimonas_sp.AAC.1
MVIGAKPRGPHDAVLATRITRCMMTPLPEEGVILRDRLLRRRIFHYDTKAPRDDIASNGIEVPFEVPLVRDMDMEDVMVEYTYRTN